MALVSGESLAFLGDIRIPDVLRKAHGDDQSPLRFFDPWLLDCGAVMANLEGPIGATDTPRSGRGALLWNAPTVIQIFKRYGNPVFVLANNHVMDFGAEGLRKTLVALDAAGIPSVGAGMNEEQARRPLILKVRGRRIGVLAYTTEERHVGSVCASGSEPGAANLMSDETFENVRSLAATTDAVCVILHWGREFLAFPEPEQMRTARRLVSAGARMVVGHHPHVIQGISMQDDALIAFSVGNGVFPAFLQTNGRMHVQSREEKEFLLLRVQPKDVGCPEWDALGGIARGGLVIPAAGGGNLRFRRRLEQLSEPLLRQDYAEFYERYARRRRRALSRAQILKAFRKLQFRNLRSIRFADLCRQWQRLRNIAGDR